MSEVPELITLQREAGSGLAILGVSLDNVPDAHGHIGGHEARENTEDHHDGQDQDRPSLNEIREKVARAVQDNGVDYGAPRRIFPGRRHVQRPGFAYHRNH